MDRAHSQLPRDPSSLSSCKDLEEAESGPDPSRETYRSTGNVWRLCHESTIDLTFFNSLSKLSDRDIWNRSGDSVQASRRHDAMQVLAVLENSLGVQEPVPVDVLLLVVR